MSNRPHTYFRNPQEGEIRYKQKTRFAGADEDLKEDEINYTPKREDFIHSLSRFFEEKKIRERNRNTVLKIPENEF